MEKTYTSIGLMSGTSMDGVDVSIIQTDGKYKYKPILDKYYEYPRYIYENLTKLRDKIKSSKDLKKYQKQLKKLEKIITIFHAKAVKKILKNKKLKVDFLGLHGQTIYHNAKEKLSRQLGDGKLLSKLTKKNVVYDFRQNDLINGGEGAPLTPLFHQLIAKKKRINLPVNFLNLGGISNVTYVKNYKTNDLIGYDIGPGNCLIDSWIRKNTKKKYDYKGLIAKKGKCDVTILNKMIKKLKKQNHISLPQKFSFDVKDFQLTDDFRKLSLEDGAATLTDFTILLLFNFISKTKKEKIILCGGGRKNTFIVKELKKISNKKKLLLIDDYNINGDFIESQAFAYLAIRSYLGLPISFPHTTGCNKPCAGGELVKNY
jgi:anhydro-N-acetylmuramic acid kinase